MSYKTTILYDIYVECGKRFSFAINSNSLAEIFTFENILRITVINTFGYKYVFGSGELKTIKYVSTCFAWEMGI